jgi:hypothetical protein
VETTHGKPNTLTTGHTAQNFLIHEIVPLRIVSNVLDFSDAASFNEYGSEGMNDGMSDGNSEHASSADEDSQLR